MEPLVAKGTVLTIGDVEFTVSNIGRERVWCQLPGGAIVFLSFKHVEEVVCGRT